MTKSSLTQADIVIEHVSMSTYNFFCPEPFLSCALHNAEIEHQDEVMGNESLSDETREAAHERKHHLEDMMCPIDRALEALDGSYGNNFFIEIGHHCGGMVTVVVNLAHIDLLSPKEELAAVRAQIAQTIAQDQMIQTTPVIYDITSH